MFDHRGTLHDVAENHNVERLDRVTDNLSNNQ